MHLINDVIYNLVVSRWLGSWLWFCGMIAEKWHRQVSPSAWLPMCFTVVPVAFNAILMRGIQSTLAGLCFPPVSLDQNWCISAVKTNDAALHSVRCLKRMSCSAMSGCARLVHVSVGPVASAFYANVVPRIKYKGTTAKDREFCVWASCVTRSVSRAPKDFDTRFCSGIPTALVKSLPICSQAWRGWCRGDGLWQWLCPAWGWNCALGGTKYTSLET